MSVQPGLLIRTYVGAEDIDTGAKYAGPTPPAPGDPFVVGATYPTDASTGSRVPEINLQNYGGSFTNVQAGDTIDRLIIPGTLVLQAPATVRDVKVLGRANPANGQSHFLIHVRSGAAGSVIEHVTVAPQSPNAWTESFRIDAAATVRRCSMRDAVDHFGITAPDVVVEGCYAHSLAYYDLRVIDPNRHSDKQTHNDAVQFYPGFARPVFRGNRLAAKYGPAGSHQPNHFGGPTPVGWPNPSCAIFMFGSNLPKNVNFGGTFWRNWLEGGDVPINGGQTGGSNIGVWHENRFDGDSRPGGTDPFTFLVAPTTTLDAGENTPLQNIYSGTNTPVRVRRNG